MSHLRIATTCHLNLFNMNLANRQLIKRFDQTRGNCTISLDNFWMLTHKLRELLPVFLCQ